MMIDDSLAESRRSRAIADDYRRQGFTVVENPSPEQLPEFLASYRPNLVAQRADNSWDSGLESVVVVVKARHRLGTESRLGELAELIREKPGWRFELALVEGEALLDTPNSAIPFGRNDIRRCNDTAQQLLAEGFHGPALLQAWAGAEATVRLLLGEERLLAGEAVVVERVSPNRLFGSAVYYGVISHEDYAALMDAVGHRNAYVHGFTLPEFDPEQAVNTIISTTERLLEYAPTESD